MHKQIDRLARGRIQHDPMKKKAYLQAEGGQNVQESPLLNLHFLSFEFIYQGFAMLKMMLNSSVDDLKLGLQETSVPMQAKSGFSFLSKQQRTMTKCVEIKNCEAKKSFQDKLD